MGASTVLMAAGLNLPDNVRGIIADCGFTSANAIWRHVAKHALHLPYGRIRSRLADRLCHKRIQMHSAEYTCADALSCSKVPVLFIHGTADSLVPCALGQHLYDACSSPKEQFLTEGADHVCSYIDYSEEYERRFEEFCRKYI